MPDLIAGASHPAPKGKSTSHRRRNRKPAPGTALEGEKRRRKSNQRQSGQSRQLSIFVNAIRRALEGRPIGQALKDFYDKYAVSSIELTDLIDTREVGGEVDPRELVLAWARRNDAGGYILLGDPAAQIVQ